MSAVYLYSCRTCGAGRKVEYPMANSRGPYRVENGQRFSPRSRLLYSGPTRPTCAEGFIVIDRTVECGKPWFAVFKGDPLGVCDACRLPMAYGKLPALAAKAAA